MNTTYVTTSVARWAVSDSTAKDPATAPPMSSTTRKKKHTKAAIFNRMRACTWLSTSIGPHFGSCTANDSNRSSPFWRAWWDPCSSWEWSIEDYHSFWCCRRSGAIIGATCGGLVWCVASCLSAIACNLRLCHQWLRNVRRSRYPLDKGMTSYLLSPFEKDSH